MTDKTQKEERSSPMKRMTRQELTDLLLKRYEELGRVVPTRKDMPEGTIGAYKSEFGKWAYALEAAGLRKPSAATLEKRRNRKKRMELLKKKSKEKKASDIPAEENEKE